VSLSVLVTGAGGYIGSVLVPMLLGVGYRVIAVDRFFFGRETLPDERPDLDVLVQDIRRLEPQVFEGVGAVIDLAALSNDPSGELDPEKTWAINHRGRVRVATLAKAAGVARYILPSTCSVYGFQEGLLDETAAVNPLTTYAQANLQAERDVLPLADASFCAVVLRQATVYGLSARMRFDLAINGMVRGFFKNGKIPILRDGTQWRPFVHVHDTAQAMLRMLEADPRLISGQIFNVGSDDQNVQIMPLAQTVAEAIGVPFAFEWYGDPDHRSYRVSFDKIRRVVQYSPSYGPSDGAREVYDALRASRVDPDDPRTITVRWYRHLIESAAMVL
jgi:nucleoside-diphosphate-sugar epimerase